MTPATDLEADLAQFIHDLSAEWEFSGELNANALLKARPVLESHVFARALLEASGMRPDREPSWMRRVKRRFAQRYRGGSISAEQFAEGV